MTTTYITPLLLMGDQPDQVRAEPVDVAQIAVHHVRVGRRVLLSEGAWDTAREVLAELKLSNDEIEGCLHFARTARVLAPRGTDD